MTKTHAITAARLSLFEFESVRAADGKD